MKERFTFRGFLGMIAPVIGYDIIMSLAGTLMVTAGYRLGLWMVIQNEYQLSFAATALGAVINIFVFREMLNRDELYYPGDYRYAKVAGLKYIYIIFLGVLMSSGLNRLLVLSGIDLLFPGFDEVSEVLYSANIWAELVVIGVIAPIAEELVFRGVVYERMKRCFSAKAAVFWCSLLFGVFHGNVVQGVYAFCLGLLMIYVKERYHTLAAPILFHMAANVHRR